MLKFMKLIHFNKYDESISTVIKDNQCTIIIFLFEKLSQMDYKDGEFNVVLDKGTLDALYSQDDQENEEKIEKMFAEISRVLRIGGRYLCITLAQSFIAKKIVQYFTNE